MKHVKLCGHHFLSRLSYKVMNTCKNYRKNNKILKLINVIFFFVVLPYNFIDILLFKKCIKIKCIKSESKNIVTKDFCSINAVF